jgi:hypothetical protein
LLWTFRSGVQGGDDPSPTKKLYTHVVKPLILALENSAQTVAHTALQSQLRLVVTIFAWCAGAGCDKHHLSDAELADVIELVRSSIASVEAELKLRKNQSAASDEVRALEFGETANGLRRWPALQLSSSPIGLNSVPGLEEGRNQRISCVESTTIASTTSSWRHAFHSSLGSAVGPTPGSQHNGNESKPRRRFRLAAVDPSSDRRRSLATVATSPVGWTAGMQVPPPLPPRRQSIGVFASSRRSQFGTPHTAPDYFPDMGMLHRAAGATVTEPAETLTQVDDVSSPPKRRARIASTPTKPSPVPGWSQPPPPARPTWSFASDSSTSNAGSGDEVGTHAKQSTRRRASIAVIGRRLPTSQTNPPSRVGTAVGGDATSTRSSSGSRRLSSLSRRLSAGRVLRSNIFGTRNSVPPDSS